MSLWVIFNILLTVVNVTAKSPPLSGVSLQLLDVRKDLYALAKIAAWIVALIKYAEQ